MRSIQQIKNELQDIPETLYHYTSIESFMSILNSAEIWLTKFDYLNDPNELTYTTDLIKEVYKENPEVANKAYLENILKRIIDQFEYSFIFSLCGNKDSLGMWSYYSKFNGINIHLSNNFYQEAYYSDSDNLFFAVNKGKVIYDREEQKQILLDIFKHYIRINQSQIDDETKRKDERSLGFLLSICFNLFKQKGLRNEEEYRFVFTGHNENLTKKINFRTHENMVIPFYIFPFNKEYIQGFTISPTSNDPQFLKSLKIFLLKHEIDFEVEKSEIILRK
jgi:hypothetical protein